MFSDQPEAVLRIVGKRLPSSFQPYSIACALRAKFGLACTSVKMARIPRYSAISNLNVPHGSVFNAVRFEHEAWFSGRRSERDVQFLRADFALEASARKYREVSSADRALILGAQIIPV
jgi:hypothetical protein